jgi:hypothetical protein
VRGPKPPIVITTVAIAKAMKPKTAFIPPTFSDRVRGGKLPFVTRPRRRERLNSSQVGATQPIENRKRTLEASAAR